MILMISQQLENGTTMVWINSMHIFFRNNVFCVAFIKKTFLKKCIVATALQHLLKVHIFI